MTLYVLVDDTTKNPLSFSATDCRPTGNVKCPSTQTMYIYYTASAASRTAAMIKNKYGIKVIVMPLRGE